MVLQSAAAVFDSWAADVEGYPGEVGTIRCCNQTLALVDGRIRCPVCATEIQQAGAEWEIVRVTAAAERRRLPRFTRPRWRVGRQVPLNIYEGQPGRAVCQCHTVADAMLIVNAVNDFYGGEVFNAMEELVKLQAHYAKLLNDYDGGHRHEFRSAREWIDRMVSLQRARKGGEKHE